MKIHKNKQKLYECDEGFLMQNPQNNAANQC